MYNPGIDEGELHGEDVTGGMNVSDDNIDRDRNKSRSRDKQPSNAFETSDPEQMTSSDATNVRFNFGAQPRTAEHTTQWNSTFNENNPDLNLSDSTFVGNSSNEAGAYEHMDESGEVQFRDDTDEVMFNFGAQHDRNHSRVFGTGSQGMNDTHQAPWTRQQSKNAPYETPGRFQFGSSESQEDVEMADNHERPTNKKKSKSNFVTTYQCVSLIFDGCMIHSCSIDSTIF